MGTLAVVDVWGSDADPVIGDIMAELARLEALWSRFVPASDVSRLNRGAGRWVEVAGETAGLLRTAVLLAGETDGAFDVLLGSGAGRSVELRDGAARIPAGARVDLGGIGKGAAVQRAVDAVGARAPSGLVNLGRSSIGVIGLPPGRDRWRVALPGARPAGEVGLTMSFAAGQLSTSQNDAGHILDPRSGEVAAGASAASVLAEDGALAEGLSTALVVLGVEAGVATATRLGCEACLVAGGRRYATPGLGGGPDGRPGGGLGGAVADVGGADAGRGSDMRGIGVSDGREGVSCV